MTTNTKLWLHGLAAAAIGGAAGSVATIAVAPNDFNLYTVRGAWHVLLVAVFTGVVNSASYLKQSPLPSTFLQAGDKASLKNPSLSPDGTLTADSATVEKAPNPTTE